MHGTFKNGLPKIDVTVIGSGGVEHTVNVIVDTGFNGGLTMPYHTAFPIGLTLAGVSSGIVADGSESPCLVCLGKVKYNDTRVDTTIELQPDCRPLLGTQLLKDLGLRFIVDATKEEFSIEQIR